jgi:phosphatidate cytidylyltransferase
MRFRLKTVNYKSLLTFSTRVTTGIVFGFVFWAIYLLLPPVFFTVLLGLIAAIIVLFEWKTLYSPSTMTFWLFLPIYPLLPFVLLIYLNHVVPYRILLFYLFLLAFTHDTSAYIVGSIFGKHKICPSVSPQKSWEGAVAGYIAALISIFLVFYQRCVICKSWLFMGFFTLIACALFIMGDLVESKMKRRAGVKDSGNLLPGHGGFLDRFDGILFAAFFVFLFRNYLITFLM